MQTEEQGNRTDIPGPPGVRKLKRSTESHVEKEEPEFNIDLRIEGIAQDVILEDERIGQTKSILEDLGKPENSMKFSESSRTIHKLANIELHELGQISRTVKAA